MVGSLRSATRLLLVGGVLTLPFCWWPFGSLAQETQSGRMVDAKLHHLGDDPAPEWTESTKDPEPSPLVIAFEATANATEWVLEVAGRDVDCDVWIELNGARLGRLKRVKPLIEQQLIVPAGAVASGRNELRALPADAKDDLLVGRFRLVEKSLREVLSLGRLEVIVHDAGDGLPLPARLTFVDARGALVELYYADERSTAVRPGIAYTRDGRAALELPAGRVTVWASRGMEWSAAHADFDVIAGGAGQVKLEIAREVDTTGWIACDTHIHTLTHSGHGDASMEERMLTLAGEGVEMPVATDHNHQIDYRPTQETMQVTRWFTPVVGNEVTTDNGHMNAFPMPPGKDVPDSKVSDWAKLVEGIRAKGAQVVILNHPRWPENGRDPLTKFGFDDQSGARREPQRFTFDCIEVVNADGPTSPPETALQCWYALLNRGERFTAIGSSDSHHVGVIVGQGRTYVPSATDDPTQIDVDAACRAFKQGRVSVSYGLFATIDVDGHTMGDTLHPDSDEVEAIVRVRHPSWITADRLELIVDGGVAATVALEPQPGDSPTDLVRRVRVRLPDHDSWLVAVASGPPIKAPFWAMQLPRALAITNPLFLDRDAAAGWSSPRATAAERLGDTRDFDAVVRVRANLPSLDDGAAIQLIELACEAAAVEAKTALATLVAASGRPRLVSWASARLASP
ncbi:MAG: hypothetical protein EXS13_04450 [Planctomycetes bacterium]|nr:hypothetical protein [Planctomycetota bacterium]